ncbi:NADH dehydrogenase subunit 6 (mitochondrion) [Carettochelys insculpta]|uniref:NADH-ubiquinone oxidoreductase chain 6 n=1 Tax=Carettochelys insculpta TaxID=44489 RepID=D5FW33_CARIN|nr:NADH dehydrogenase subunit 6 [Carettochelys insculpta]ACO83370.1 NADH dehydrogenase subunit 6 [Carettochelys insculpta]
MVWCIVFTFLGCVMFYGRLVWRVGLSPYYGVVGLVFGAIFGCAMLVGVGGSFVGLVLFLIYLGGMLVVFAYSIALAGDVYPLAWSGRDEVMWCVGYVVFLLLMVVVLCNEWGVGGFGMVVGGVNEMFVVRADFSGVSWFYWWGGLLLMVVGWGLFLTLFVVLSLVRGVSRCVLRAI